MGVGRIILIAQEVIHHCNALMLERTPEEVQTIKCGGRFKAYALVHVHIELRDALYLEAIHDNRDCEPPLAAAKVIANVSCNRPA